MARIFKYGRIFDITIICFLCSLILIGILIINGINKNTPPDLKMTAKTKTELFTGLLGENQMIVPGDTVRILGQDMTHAGCGMKFWVQTQDGRRGWAAQEAFDNKAIVFNISKKDIGINVAVGDTVEILDHKNKTFGDYTVKTAEGQVGDLRYDDILTVTGTSLQDYNIGFNTGYFMSVEKFKRLYMGKSFDEVDNMHRQARYIVLAKNGKIAEYRLNLFDKNDGKFYYPVITFENGVATSYELKLDKKTNSFILKYLPLVDTFLDIPFFSNLISGKVYSSEMPNSENSIFIKILGILGAICLIIGFLGWLFFTNHLVSLFLFGTLRFRYPLIFMNDKVVWYTLLVIDVVFTYIWMVLGLCYSFYWWYFIPILLFCMSFLFKRLKTIFNNYPNTRCPSCKYLYSIKYNRKDFEREYDQWRKKTERGKIVDSRTQKWKTWDDVTTTTTHADGSKSSHTEKKNIQHHQQTINYYEYHVYNVLYHVTDYRHVYKCAECGYEESDVREELEELDRKLKETYVGR